MSSGFYKFAIGLARGWRAVCHPLDLQGKEHLNVQGGALLVCNHISMRDPVIQGCLSPRPLRFMGKKELFGNKLLARLFTALGGISVDRGNSDVASVRECLSALKKGDVLSIFPQGHRYPADDNRDVKDGAAFLALYARVPVIPMHIEPPYRLFRKTKVRVGAPIDLSDVQGLDQAAVAEVSRRIQKGIWG